MPDEVLRKAWVVMWIETATQRLVGAAVYSEDCPTDAIGGRTPIVMCSAEGETYEEAAVAARAKASRRPWLAKLLTDSEHAEAAPTRPIEGTPAAGDPLFPLRRR